MSGYIREKSQAKIVTKRLNNKKMYPKKEEFNISGYVTKKVNLN